MQIPGYATGADQLSPQKSNRKKDRILNKHWDFGIKKRLKPKKGSVSGAKKKKKKETSLSNLCFWPRKKGENQQFAAVLRWE